MKTFVILHDIAVLIAATSEWNLPDCFFSVTALKIYRLTWSVIGRSLTFFILLTSTTLSAFHMLSDICLSPDHSQEVSFKMMMKKRILFVAKHVLVFGNTSRDLIKEEDNPHPHVLPIN